jgi:putative transposase
MPRKPRLEYAGAVYHVMDRGDRSEDIFHDHKDRQRFLATLGQACGRTGWRIHSFVLMRNHYHLLLETPAPNLSRGMHWLQTTYTVRHNKRHNLRGHLFQGRYKAIVVEAEADDYFATISNYIHLNPLRAGLLRASQKLREYPWSSFPLLCAAPSQRPDWLESSRVLAAHGVGDSPVGRRRFRLHMEQRVRSERRAPQASSEDWRAVREAWAIGSDEFRRRMRSLLADRSSTDSGETTVAWHDEEEAKRLINNGRITLGAENFSRMPKNHASKIALGAFVKARTTVSNQWLGEQLVMGHASRVSRYCQGAADCPEVARLVLRLEKAHSKA